MKTTANGFATKGDLKKLEQKMDLRFGQVDKRFAQVDKRFEQVDLRFGQVDKKLNSLGIQLGVFKLDWDMWKQDAFTEFNSRWVNRIDPILAEIETHRQKEVLWAEQAKRREEEWTKELKEMRLEGKNREEKWAAQLSQTKELVEKIAKKVGA